MIETDYIYINNTCFNNNQTIENVDLNYRPWNDNSMSYAFYNCRNLKGVSNIHDGVTSMYMTFAWCQNFNQPIVIPNNVTDMYYTFYYCYNFNQPITIPNSVTNMTSTFNYCNNFNQPVTIPNNVTNMASTFSSCHNFNQPITIPNSVTNMYRTFSSCQNFNQPITIGNSVTNMASTFSSCQNFNQPITIPNNVTNMRETFYSCLKLNNQNIVIKSADITNATDIFNVTFLRKNVTIPHRYINNANTQTFNSFKTAGYVMGNGVGEATINGVYSYDHIRNLGFLTYVGNGTHWQLTKWGTTTNTATDITVPSTITTYDTFPTAVNVSTFTGNTVISSINIPNTVAWVSNRMGWYTNSKSYGGVFLQATNLKRANIWLNSDVTSCAMAFYNCTSLEYVNMKFSDDTKVTSMWETFYGCTNLKATNSGTSFKTGVADMDIPNTVTTAYAMFSNCKNIHTFYLNGTGITNVAYLIEYCNTRNLNVYIKSPNVTDQTNFSRGYVATYTKNLYIPYMNSDGTYTKTHNTFNGAVYINNTTSGFYRYDTSPYNSVADYFVTVTSPNMYYNTYRGQSTTPVVPTTSPFTGNTPYLTNTTFRTNASITSLDCKNVPFAGTITHASFLNCFNLIEIKNVNIPDSVANLQAMFENCKSMLNNPINNTSASCTQGAYLYKGCTNLGLQDKQTIRFGQNVINYRQTFNGCSNLWGDIYFFNWTTTTATNKWNGTFTGYNTQRRKNLYMYFTYQNGVNTPIYNILKAATYNNNATSNFYIYDMVQIMTSNFTISSSTSVAWDTLMKYTGTSPNVNIVNVYPARNVYVNNLCFSSSNAVNVELNGVMTSSNSLYSVFEDARQLAYVNGINPNCTFFRSTFRNCINLNQNIKLPDATTNMYGIFSNCTKLNQNIRIPIGTDLTDLDYVFNNCTNLNQNIYIPDNITRISSIFNNCSNMTNLSIGARNIAYAGYFLTKTNTKRTNVYIYQKYSNGVNTKTYNTLCTASVDSWHTNWFSNGVSVANVWIYDFNGTLLSTW